MMNNENGRNREVSAQATNETQRVDDQYVAPAIQTYSSEEFLEVLGPAQGYIGTGPTGNKRFGWGNRLFPGFR